MADENANVRAGASDSRVDLMVFLERLTLLSRECGIAINGNPELVLMDPEDAFLSYKADAESRLSLD